MKKNQIGKNISIIYFILLFTSCGAVERAIEPRVTTNVEATVTNNGSEDITANAQAIQNYDANHCTPDRPVQSGSFLISPGQATHLYASIQCNSKVRTNIYIVKHTNYNIGYIMLSQTGSVANLRPGVQFRITDKNYQNVLSIQIVNSISPTGNYDHFWSLSPTGTSQVAWLNPTVETGYSSGGVLYFSLPKDLSPEMNFIEFDENLGISKWGPYAVEHVNGVYRGEFDKYNGAPISSKMSHGSLLCDDIGCNEVY